MRYQKNRWWQAILLLLFACNRAGEQKSTNSSQLSAAKQYFLSIAFAPEYGEGAQIKKWIKDVRIFVPDTTQTQLNRELDNILVELKPLIGEIRIYRVDSRSKANFMVYFGNASTYVNTYAPEAEHFVGNNQGLFWVHWDEKSAITDGSMYVDIERTGDVECQKHLLREELTQSLGLMQDTQQYPTSIFQQNWTCNTTYSNVDRKLIQLLYLPAIKPGMTKKEVINLF